MNIQSFIQDYSKFIVQIYVYTQIIVKKSVQDITDSTLTNAKSDSETRYHFIIYRYNRIDRKTIYIPRSAIHHRSRIPESSHFRRLNAETKSETWPTEGKIRNFRRKI